jgi:hypothetical protein
MDTISKVFLYSCLLAIAILILSLICYFVTKGIMIGFYECKLFYKNKLKETNHDENRQEEGH